ncbi:uncharacterized protein Tco025E_05982 [Trypanosoma conorhini]|uniref:Amastin n=1 Tax=Trypanosoma conorhini TaxID=83891 RepID=A0A3R7LGN9_9TRYP|nr:uncharacterized protein Tco025E_05982 [Trypanosoma conorhini]RNF14025.1 hypothetical protein Tco025E_05982 [Trypanosoma conorhini]
MNETNNVGSRRPHLNADVSTAAPTTPEPSTASEQRPPPLHEFDIGPKVVAGAYVLICVCLAVAVGAPWFLMEQYAAGPEGRNVGEMFQLWKTTISVGSAKRSMGNGLIACAPARREVVALQALSVVVLAISLFTLFLSVVRDRFMRGNSKLRLALIYCVAVVFVVLTAESSVGIDLFTRSFSACGAGTSYHSRGFELHLGFATTMTAWVLSALAGVAVYNRVPLPMDTRVIEYGANAFAMLAFVAFLFSLVACPIPQWFYKDIARRTLTEVLLWRERYSVLWVTNSSHNSTEVGNLGCRPVFRCFLAVELFSILTIILNAATFLFGVLLAKGLFGFVRHALVLGYTSTAVAVIQWVLLLCIYYRDWCAGAVSYHRKKYVLAAGFALSVSACVVMGVATVLLAYTERIRRNHFSTFGHLKTLREVLVEMAQ